MNRFSLDFISVLGMPPAEHVRLAAELGCSGVSLALAPFTANPHGYPDWSLRDDAGLCRDVKMALNETGLRIGLGEGYLVRPGAEVADCATDLDLMAELGVERVNILSIDGDAGRVTDQLSLFADMAAGRGMGATLEYMAGMPIGSLGAAVQAICTVGHSNLKLMIDCMHLARGGNTPADLAAIDPALMGYLQLCDCPLVPNNDNYGEEAKHNRLAPGEGNLPLAEILAVAPRGIPVGLEVPMLNKAEAGLAPRTYLGEAVQKALALLAATGGA